jgi:hypothetical protein
MDTTGRRIHIQGVLSLGRTCGKKCVGKKGRTPQRDPRATILRRGHFSAVADGSAGAAGLTIGGPMILLEVKRGTAGLVTSIIDDFGWADVAGTMASTDDKILILAENAERQANSVGFPTGGAEE